MITDNVYSEFVDFINTVSEDFPPPITITAQPDRCNAGQDMVALPVQEGEVVGEMVEQQPARKKLIISRRKKELAVGVAGTYFRS